VPIATTCRFSVFDNGSEAGFWVSPDSIRDMAVDSITRAESSDAVLACADGTIRVCASGPPVLSLATSGGGAGDSSASLSCVEVYPTSLGLELSMAGGGAAPTATAARYHHLVWASEGGQLGEALTDGRTMRRGWTLPNSGAHRGGGATSLTCAVDVTGDGLSEVVLGRDDGQVQVFGFDATSATDGTPLMLLAEHLGESVRSLDGGVLNSDDHTEVVLQTRGGRVVSLTTESMTARDADDKYGRSKATVQKEEQVVRLRAEIEALKARTKAAEATLQTEASKGGVDIADLGIAPPSSDSGLAGGSAAREAKAAVDSLRGLAGPGALVLEAPAGAASAQLAKAFDVTTAFTLDPVDGVYRLVVEAPVAIDLVVLDVPTVSVEVLDSLSESGAIVSVTRAPYGGGVLCTYRSQDSQCTRIESRLRFVEGQSGDIHVTVVAAALPQTAQVARVSVKPLSLHHRLPGGRVDAESVAASSWVEARGPAEVPSEVDEAGEVQSPKPRMSLAPPPLSKLRVTGDFDLMQAHGWVTACVNDAPSRPPLVSDAAAASAAAMGRKEASQLAFRSTFLGTVLIVSYSAGEAVFESDSITSLAVVKETISDDAARIGVPISFRFEAGPDALLRALCAVRAPLERQLGLSRRAELYEAVKEISQSEESISFLSPELRDVLEHGEAYKRELRGQPRALHLLFGTVTETFIDWHKFQGKDVSAQVPALIDLLRRYNFQDIVAFVGLRRDDDSK
jgi:Bardet-Biedl syndrome 7 protein